VDVETFLIWEMSLRKLKSSSILFIGSKYYSCLLSSQVYQIKFIDTITSKSSSVCRPATPINAVFVRLSAGV
jgi:ABC-type siderophore export system fused ATPase/permease subunit